MNTDFPPPQFPSPSEEPTQFVPVVSGAHVAWPKRKWLKLPLWAWIAVGVLAVGAIGSAAGSKKDNAQPAAVGASATDAATTLMPTTLMPTTLPATTVAATTTVPATTVPATTSAPTTTLPPVTMPPVTVAPATLPPPPPTIGETVSQKNARQKAGDYLDFMAFSRSGLIHQLVFEGFTQEQAEYGVSTTGL